MRSSAARRLVQAARLLAREGNQTLIRSSTVREAVWPQVAACDGFRKLGSWKIVQNRGFAQQPAAKDVPVDSEHSNISNEIEKELLKASEHSGVSGLLKVVEQHGEDFDEQNVATAFHELAKSAKGKDLEDVHVHDTFQALVDMAILGRRRFNARLLTSIVQSAAELKFSDEALLDKLSQNLLTRMDKLDAVEVTDLATGLAAMDHSPSVILFEALQKRANDIQNDFSDAQKKDLKKAFEKLGYGDYAKKL